MRCICLDNYAGETGSLRFQGERPVIAKVFHLVQIVRGATEQASALRFRLEEYIILLANTWCAETSESLWLRRNYPNESLKVQWNMQTKNSTEFLCYPNPFYPRCYVTETWICRNWWTRTNRCSCLSSKTCSQGSNWKLKRTKIYKKQSLTRL